MYMYYNSGSKVPLGRAFEAHLLLPDSKQVYPLHWDISCAGHVCAEDYHAGPDTEVDLDSCRTDAVRAFGDAKDAFHELDAAFKAQSCRAPSVLNDERRIVGNALLALADIVDA